MTPRPLAALAAFALALGVASPASAEREPIKNTTYTGSTDAAAVHTTATVKVGKSKAKVNKLVIDQTCAEGVHHVVFKNLKVVEGSFSRDVGGEGVAADYNLRGVWFTKHKVSLLLYIRKGPCDGTFDFFAKD